MSQWFNWKTWLAYVSLGGFVIGLLPQQFSDAKFIFGYAWFGIAGVALVLVLLAARKERLRARRVKERRCVDCGQSLRGNETGVCPTCGKRFPVRRRPAVDPESGEGAPASAATQADAETATDDRSATSPPAAPT